MEGPIKKRKIKTYSKLLFELVYPYLLNGHYENKWLAFRSLLALNGTCRQLRYFQYLRRVIGYLTPAAMQKMMSDHGFSVYAPFFLWEQALGLRLGHGNVLYVLNSLMDKKDSVFEKNIGIAPFFNLARRLEANGPQKVFLLHAPGTFPELALFCYCVVTCPIEQIEEYDGIEIVPQWKTKKSDKLMIPVKTREVFASKHLLGKLIKMGNSMMPDFEFLHGALEEPSYSLFCQICNTSGRKDRQKPVERLLKFVQAWFPETKHSVGPNDLKRRAYEFEMEFLK